MAEAEGGVADGAQIIPAEPARQARARPAITRTASIPRPWTTAIAPRCPETATTAREPRRQRPGFAAPFAPADPEPLPALREDSNSRIFAFVDDLFFAAKIQETARKLNVKVEFAKNDKDLADRMQQNGEEKPSLIIFDLNNANAKPLTLIPKAEGKVEEGNLDHRIPLACARGSEAEGSRSGLRHGSAAVRFLAESSSTAAPPRSLGRREPDGTVGNGEQRTKN